MNSLTFRLGWPPTVNHYYGYVKGIVYLKPAGRDYRLRAAAEFARLGSPRLSGQVRVALILSPPDKRRWGEWFSRTICARTRRRPDTRITQN